MHTDGLILLGVSILLYCVTIYLSVTKDNKISRLERNLKDDVRKNTEEYISKVLNRLTVVGSLFLVVLAGLPILCSLIPNMPKNVTVGGTGLLIVVGVALETYNQIENQLVSRNYSRSYK